MIPEKISNTESGDANSKSTFAELDHAQKAYNEVTLMLEQSRVDYENLNQRNASINIQLQHIQSQIDVVSPKDISLAYGSMLESQQRILITQGQIEKLQSEQKYLKQIIDLFEKLPNLAGEVEHPEPGPRQLQSGQVLLEKLINAQEAERQRLSRQMHDGPAQALSNFIVQAEIATRLFEVDPTRAQEELENLKTSALNTFQKVRLFITNLRPMMLDDLGLIPTLKRFVDTFKEETGCETELEIKSNEYRLEPYLEVMIFRAVQELMGNADKHNQESGKKPKINVLLSLDADQIKVVVSDNGSGFYPDILKNCTGVGLKIIQERVGMLGGTVEILSQPENGARISILIPVELSYEVK